MNLRLTSSVLALAATTGSALADVTSEQVWQSWIDYYQSLGYTVTEGGRDKAGDTLTLTGIAISGGAADSRISLDIPSVTLSDTGDGKVRTVFADRMTGEAQGTDPDGESYSLPFAVDMPGNVTMSSGAPQDMTHEFDYPVVDFTLTALKTGDKETPLPIKLGLAASTGSFHVVPGAPASYDYAMRSGRLSFSGQVDNEEGEKVGFEGVLSDLEANGEMSVPGDARIEDDMNAALKAGLATSGVLKSGTLVASFDFSGSDETGQPTSGAGKYDGKGFDLAYSLSQDGMAYQAGSDAGRFELTSSDMPFPINYAIESGSFDMQLPVMKSDEPQPFKLAYSLSGLTLGDAIWNLFDAQGQLPRDPASLDLDVTGLMQVAKDLFDPALMTPPEDSAPGQEEGGPEQTEAAEPEPQPFEPVEVTVNQLALAALGAQVHAQGMLRAPQGGGMTTPVGEISANYEGVNGLIDKLGAMGLIPEDRIMGVRMMMAMFAKPVAEGEDKLETRLEFKEDGAIFANGQQIR